MISQNHSNRRAYNWLAYQANDHFLEKLSHLYKGSLYDLGSGESPYKEFFLQYAQQYIAVDWAGSYHDTKTDIVADLNKPLPIEARPMMSCSTTSFLTPRRKICGVSSRTIQKMTSKHTTPMQQLRLRGFKSMTGRVLS